MTEEERLRARVANLERAVMAMSVLIRDSLSTECAVAVEDMVCDFFNSSVSLNKGEVMPEEFNVDDEYLENPDE